MSAHRIEDVLVAVGTGDRAAFEELYDATAHRVHGLCRRLLRDRSAAEDVTQEVLLAVWAQASRFDPERGSAMAWILRITHAKAVDRVRKAESTRRRDDAFHRSCGDLDHDHTAETALLSVEGDLARRALAGLSETQRSALTLAYFEGLTHAQVAARLGIPLGTAKTRIRDGLRAMRRTMPEAEPALVPAAAA